MFLPFLLFFRTAINAHRRKIKFLVDRAFGRRCVGGGDNSSVGVSARESFGILLRGDDSKLAFGQTWPLLTGNVKILSLHHTLLE